ncbi:interferon-induced protein 44-like [Alosa pseudoharengus]|uniref:interferon-induced protein 44-like n=1 Tax=Alosa pseudoharengus TaxID=34774 RepID=UPI003F8B12D1
MESIRSYKPACDSVPAARVLLIGPVGAGKSSFISSIQSVFYGRVVNRAMMGSSSSSSTMSSSTSFTKKLEKVTMTTELQSYKLYGSREIVDESMALVLSDMVGLGDTLAVIKGHVPEGHTFSACYPVVSDTPGYVKEPSLAEKVHCVVFVVSGLEISSYSDTMKSTFHQLRELISALGVHQVALLTHVDQICPKTASDISQVYKISSLKQVVIPLKNSAGWSSPPHAPLLHRAPLHHMPLSSTCPSPPHAPLLHMPLSSIVPVKNYSEELELDPQTDTLLLRALDHILQSVDLHLRDQGPERQHRGLPQSRLSDSPEGKRRR